MIYIETKNEVVMFVHNFPFDENSGLHKTEEELKQTGYLVDELPEPEIIPGKNYILKYDGVNFEYEYFDTPITQEEQALQDLESLKEQNAQMLFALVQGGLM